MNSNMYQNIHCQHFILPCDMRFQFAYNLRGVEKATQPFSLFLRTLQEKKVGPRWRHLPAEHYHNYSILFTDLNQRAGGRKQEKKNLQLLTSFQLPVLVNLRSCSLKRPCPLKMCTFIKHVIEKQCSRWIQTGDLSVSCCNKTWASGSDFYFEIIRIASFFTSVTMVILSCSDVILI